MSSCNFELLIAFIIFLGEIQEGLLLPSASTGDNIEHLNQMFNVTVLLNRLEYLEAKNEQHEVTLEKIEAKVAEQELKIKNQQFEIDQLEKKNSDLEEKTHQLILAAGAKKNDTTNCDFLLRSCFELKAMNPNAQSGVYSIDPDGQIGGDPSIQVYCDMTAQTTSIYHDTEVKTDVTSCGDPGCYTKAIKYNATMRQMLNLADISASCKQYFRFDSFAVPLEYSSTRYGYWNDRNGGKQIFWAGPATSGHTCQCGIMNNCVEKSYKCNADSLAPIELADEGFITATELLPVTSLSFGRTSLTGVKASFTLGRFECTGKATISSKPSNCRNLFKLGHTLSGFYDVKGESNQISLVYCDFSKASTETGFETRVGFVDVKSSPVHFFVTRTSSWSTVGTMPFNVEYLNLGGGINLASGVFTATKDGIYAFTFKGLGFGSGSGYAGHGDVRLQRNGVDVAKGYSKIDFGKSDSWATLSVHSTLKLNKGDRINIHHGGGTIGSGDNNDIQFTRSLIEEDNIIS